MSTELLESVLVDVSRTAQFPITIAWHGGEPLLAGKAFFRRAIELVNQHFEPGTVKNSVQTNGVLLDDEWLKMFQSAGFSLGISLDGPATIHDVKRVYRSGLGSFSRVERSAKRAKALGIPLNAICVVGDLHEGKAALVLQSFERLGIGN